jgi:glutamate 5-kinase
VTTAVTNAHELSYDLAATFDRKLLFANVKRVVVKVGTSTLSGENHRLDTDFIAVLMEQIADLRQRGIEVALVSSGAVGAGIGALDLHKRPAEIEGLQAVAAVGQSLLMHYYDHAASSHGIKVAQVLLSAADLRRKSGYQNVQNVFRALFRYGALPIVNENDSVAVEELKFGDNDSLSAHVTNLIGGEVLIILSDIDGLYEGFPDADHRPPLVRTVYSIDSTVEALCGLSRSGVGIGGMKTKVNAAKTLAASGVATIIVNGRATTLGDVLSGADVGTVFLAGAASLHRTRHHRWVLAQKVAGRLVVDAGAAAALVERNTSLLPSGIKKVTGKFVEGEAVSIAIENGEEIARGVTRYGADEVKKIARHHSKDIAAVLGFTRGDEIVHRDNLVTVANGMASRGT